MVKKIIMLMTMILLSLVSVNADTYAPIYINCTGFEGGGLSYTSLDFAENVYVYIDRNSCDGFFWTDIRNDGIVPTNIYFSSNGVLDKSWINLGQDNLFTNYPINIHFDNSIPEIKFDATENTGSYTNLWDIHDDSGEIYNLYFSNQDVVIKTTGNNLYFLDNSNLYNYSSLNLISSSMTPLVNGDEITITENFGNNTLDVEVPISFNNLNLATSKSINATLKLILEGVGVIETLTHSNIVIVNGSATTELFEFAYPFYEGNYYVEIILENAEVEYNVFRAIDVTGSTIFLTTGNFATYEPIVYSDYIFDNETNIICLAQYDSWNDNDFVILKDNYSKFYQPNNLVDLFVDNSLGQVDYNVNMIVYDESNNVISNSTELVDTNTNWVYDLIGTLSLSLVDGTNYYTEINIYDDLATFTPKQIITPLCNYNASANLDASALTPTFNLEPYYYNYIYNDEVVTTEFQVAMPTIHLITAISRLNQVGVGVIDTQTTTDLTPDGAVTIQHTFSLVDDATYYVEVELINQDFPQFTLNFTLGNIFFGELYYVPILQFNTFELPISNDTTSKFNALAQGFIGNNETLKNISFYFANTGVTPLYDINVNVYQGVYDNGSLTYDCQYILNYTEEISLSQGFIDRTLINDTNAVLITSQMTPYLLEQDMVYCLVFNSNSQDIINPNDIIMFYEDTDPYNELGGEFFKTNYVQFASASLGDLAGFIYSEPFVEPILVNPEFIQFPLIDNFMLSLDNVGIYDLSYSVNSSEVNTISTIENLYKNVSGILTLQLTTTSSNLNPTDNVLKSFNITQNGFYVYEIILLNDLDNSYNTSAYSNQIEFTSELIVTQGMFENRMADAGNGINGFLDGFTDGLWALLLMFLIFALIGYLIYPVIKKIGKN